MKILLLLLCMCLPAFSQRKNWSWKSPELGGDWNATGIISAASDANGNTVLVLGEYVVTGATSAHNVRILWIAATGVVLHETTESTGLSAEYLLGVEPVGESHEPWKILFAGGAGCAVTNGRSLWLGARKGKTTTFKRTELESAPIAAGWTPAFQGWIERTGRMDDEGLAGRFFEYRSRHNFSQRLSAVASTLDELSLWSLK